MDKKIDSHRNQINAIIDRAYHHIKRNRWAHTPDRYRSLIKIKLNNEIKPPLDYFSVSAWSSFEGWSNLSGYLYSIDVNVQFKENGVVRNVLRTFGFIPPEKMWFNNGFLS